MALLVVGILTALSTFVPVTDARVRAPERPVVPNVTATSPTEIKMSWCRVKPNNIEVDHYELFIDNELEYSGMDVMYVAKRLKPWSWYEVKLRACGFQPGFSCSPFSRPILVKTLASGENNTAIESTATMFRKVVLPTYMFIAGVLVGVVFLAMALIWRYLQSNDSWMNEPAFELPTHVQPQKPLFLKGKMAKLNAFLLNNMAGNTSNKSQTTKEPLQDEKNAYHQIVDTDTLQGCDNSPVETNIEKQEMSVQTVDPCLLDCNVEDTQYIEPSSHDVQIFPWYSSRGDPKQQNCPINLEAQNQHYFNWSIRQAPCHNFQESSQLYHETSVINTVDDSYVHSMEQSAKPILEDTTQEMNLSSSDESDDQGVVIVVDNSNIYIGAQECASANNAHDRKRHVRVKLQNLVKILEKNRTKERTFVCGSSPPATEHVWDVYRHLGYVVDLEERRGKDEQRVDEGLHLFIYKAICELSPRVLVLASGDGMKGKSENSTSFPGCATMALEKGWSVEVYSWKHSLSTEWLKLAKKYPDHLSIHYLDKYVNHITFVDGKHGRKCLPVDGGHGKERQGRLTYHNG